MHQLESINYSSDLDPNGLNYNVDYDTPFKFVDFTFGRLVAQARQKVESEMEKADSNRFLFNKVSSLETLQPVSAIFDYRLTIRKDYFEFELDHASGTEWPPMMVEAYLLGPDKALEPRSTHTVDSLVICTLEDPGRAMLFPAFRHRHLQLEAYSESMSPGDTSVVNRFLTLATNTGSRFTLRCPDEAQISLWKHQLEKLFPKKEPLRLSDESIEGHVKSHSTSSYSFSSRHEDILSDPFQGLNIINPMESLTLDPSTIAYPSRPSSYSISPQLATLESSTSLADAPELKAFLTSDTECHDDVEIVSPSEASSVHSDEENLEDTPNWGTQRIEIDESYEVEYDSDLSDCYDSALEEHTDSGLEEKFEISSPPIQVTGYALSQTSSLPHSLPPCPPPCPAVPSPSTRLQSKPSSLILPIDEEEEKLKQIRRQKREEREEASKPVAPVLQRKKSNSSFTSFFLLHKRSNDALSVNLENKSQSTNDTPHVEIQEPALPGNIVNSTETDSKPVPTLKRKKSTSERLVSAFKSISAKLKVKPPTPIDFPESIKSEDEVIEEPEPELKSIIKSPNNKRQSMQVQFVPSPLGCRGDSSAPWTSGEFQQVLAPVDRSNKFRADRALSKISEEIFLDVSGDDSDEMDESDEEEEYVGDVSTDSVATHISTAVTAVMASPLLVLTGSESKEMPHSTSSSSVGTAVDTNSNNETVKLGHARKLSNTASLRVLHGSDSYGSIDSLDRFKRVSRKSSSEFTLSESRQSIMSPSSSINSGLDFSKKNLRRVSILQTVAVVSKWQSMNWVRISESFFSVTVFVTATGGLISCTLPPASSNSLNVINEDEASQDVSPSILEIVLPSSSSVSTSPVSRRTALDVHVRQASDTYLFRLRSSHTADEFVNNLDASCQELTRQVLLCNPGDSSTSSNSSSINEQISGSGSMTSSNSSGSLERSKSPLPLLNRSSSGSLKMSNTPITMTTFLPPLLSTRNSSSSTVGGGSPVNGSKTSLNSVDTINGCANSNIISAVYREPELLLLNNLRCQLFKRSTGDKWLDMGLARLRVYSVPMQSEWRRIMLLSPTSSQVILDTRLPCTCFMPAGTVGLSISIPMGQQCEPTYMLRLRNNKEVAHVSELLTC